MIIGDAANGLGNPRGVTGDQLPAAVTPDEDIGEALRAREPFSARLRGGRGREGIEHHDIPVVGGSA
jgi:hypothetical protein